MTKILVTGSNGFLGQHIAAQAGNMPNVHLTGWSKRPAIHNYCNDFKTINVLENDITPEIVAPFDAVIHTAALSHVDYCEQHREEAFRINVEATRQIAKACRQTGTHLIHLSSDFVFPGKDEPVAENDKTDPVNYYGRTKEMAEIYVQTICPQSTIIRPVLIFGPVLSGTRSNLVLWVKSALEAGKAIQVTSDHTRKATYVKDLATLCLQAAQKPQRGIYHACGADYLSVHEMALQVANVFELDSQLITPVHSGTFANQAPRPACSNFSAKNAIHDFGFKSRTFQEALRDMV